MFKIFLTIDPQSGRGLYDNESRFLGVFNSLSEAEKSLGQLLNFCSICSLTAN